MAEQSLRKYIYIYMVTYLPDPKVSCSFFFAGRDPCAGVEARRRRAAIARERNAS